MRQNRNTKPEKIEDFIEIAKKIRRKTLNIIYRSKSAHIGPSFSIVEILIALYFKCLYVSPDRVQDQNRDRFILSKGHGCPALYAVLAQRGFIDANVLKGFAIDGGTLEQHPTRDIMKGIEVSSGSLGHGLSIGVGMALAAKNDQLSHRVFTLLSDGEINEGSTWEAILFAPQHKLDNLIAIVDYNKIQALGRNKDIINLEPFAEKWRAFGWEAQEVDGHSFDQLIAAFERIPFKHGKPSVIIAHTIKGKGVSFMEDKLLWHYRCPDEEEYKKALEELS